MRLTSEEQLAGHLPEQRPLAAPHWLQQQSGFRLVLVRESVSAWEPHGTCFHRFWSQAACYFK